VKKGRIRIRIRIRNRIRIHGLRCGSGSGKMMRILADPDPDPQHWLPVPPSSVADTKLLFLGCGSRSRTNLAGHCRLGSGSYLVYHFGSGFGSGSDFTGRFGSGVYRSVRKNFIFVLKSNFLCTKWCHYHYIFLPRRSSCSGNFGSWKVKSFGSDRICIRSTALPLKFKFSYVLIVFSKSI